MENKNLAKWLTGKGTYYQANNLSSILGTYMMNLTLTNSPLISICAHIWRHTHK